MSRVGERVEAFLQFSEDRRSVHGLTCSFPATVLQNSKGLGFRGLGVQGFFRSYLTRTRPALQGSSGTISMTQLQGLGVRVLQDSTALSTRTQKNPRKPETQGGSG